MSDPFVAEIRLFPFSFAPNGWAFCNGQLLPLSQNTALFSLLGTTYGGDGSSEFALPNLRGRAPMQPGQGPGLSLHDLGETGGSETTTLLVSEMPAHAHALMASPNPGETPGPDNPDGSPNGLARSVGGSVYGEPSNLAEMATLPIAGGDRPHNNLMPYLTVNFCIALQGVFPPRT